MLNAFLKSCCIIKFSFPWRQQLMNNDSLPEPRVSYDRNYSTIYKTHYSSGPEFQPFLGHPCCPPLLFTPDAQWLILIRSILSNRSAGVEYAIWLMRPFSKTFLIVLRFNVTLPELLASMNSFGWGDWWPSLPGTKK